MAKAKCDLVLENLAKAPGLCRGAFHNSRGNYCAIGWLAHCVEPSVKGSYGSTVGRVYDISNLEIIQIIAANDSFRGSNAARKERMMKKVKEILGC